MKPLSIVRANCLIPFAVLMCGCGIAHKRVDMPPLEVAGQVQLHDAGELRVIEAPYGLESQAILKVLNEPGFEGPNFVDIVKPQLGSAGVFRITFTGEMRTVGGPFILMIPLFPGEKTQHERRLFIWFEKDSDLHRITLRGNKAAAEQAEFSEMRTLFRHLAKKHNIARLTHVGPGGDDPNTVPRGQGLKEAELDIEFEKSIKWRKADKLSVRRISRTAAMDTLEFEIK